jgi:hypothetical protein
MLAIVLDPSRENAAPAEWTLIETEVDFLRYDVGCSQLWISGEYLCRWAADVYRVRGLREGEHYQVVKSQRRRLQRFIGDKATEVDKETLERVIRVLNERPEITLGGLLAQLTSDDVWLGSPSKDHAARWLLAEIDCGLYPFVAVQQQSWIRECRDELLKPLYEVAPYKREERLKEWLRAESANSLGVFPVEVEGTAVKVLIYEWGKQLRESLGAAIEHLSPTNPNAKHIAQAAYDYFNQHPKQLTKDIAKRIGPHLSAHQRALLEESVPKSCPLPLAADAAVEQALRWTVEEYLPYRQWQVSVKATDEEEKIAWLGDSFTDWILNNYPQLSTSSRESSMLNVRVKYAVETLLEQSPVLWVVVDGLNYLNHQHLLRLLAQTEAALGIEEDHVLLAVLPTITETAKYGMTSGLFPGERPNSIRNIKEAFTQAFGVGVYASSSRIDSLHAALSDKNFRLGYWNMIDIDDCYHDQTDPSAARRNLEARLFALAQHISDLVMKSPLADQLGVVICTDHGQMIGPCVKAGIPLKGHPAHGRTAYGNLLQNEAVYANEAFVKDVDETMVVLNQTRFRLGESTTITLKNWYFGGWREDAQHRAWGVHGGLYPEEVVVGFSVLRRKPTRQLVTATISGSGEALKPGMFTIAIDNPNNASVTNLVMILDAVEECKHGLPLSATVRPVGVERINVEVRSFPTPSTGDSLEVKGMLIYEFGDGVRHESLATGTLTSKQMYNNQRPSLRDKFKQ